MRRYLVVAHQTLVSPELLNECHARHGDGDACFHLLVPKYLGHGLVWTEGEVAAAARRRLDDGLTTFVAKGWTATGEVGDSNPVYAVTTALRNNRDAPFSGIIVSTLPLGLSRWIRLDVPKRIQKACRVPVHHIVSEVATV
jgi:hypothetical protein